MKKIFLLGLVVWTSVIYAQKPVYYLMKGKALVENGKPEEAVAELTSVLELLPESRVFIERAEAYMAAGNYSAAIGDFISANKLVTASGDYGLARIYAIRGDAATAMYHLESCMRSPFRKSEKEILLDPSFSPIENRPEWRQFWQKNWFTTLEKGVAEIKYNILTGNTDDANQLYREIAGIYKDNNEIKYVSALISNAEKNYAGSLSSLSSILAEDPENEKILRLYAETQMLSGNYAGASTTFTKMMDLNIPDPEFLMKRAECFRRTGETTKALDDVTTYIGFYPDSRKALGFAGKIASASGDNLRALSFFSENIRLHPNDAECYIDRADSYFISKSWKWAIQDYSMALDLQPGNSEVWLNKGIALLNVGSTGDACHDFRQAFFLGSKKSTEYISRHCIK